ncbi:hsp70 nucleotide exchange factor fes1 [Terramyces sp. JEL0728]|nr:hsp70 nucleotide exchange factor fes1 [Terramyces sp. JEL0728]
MTERVTPTQLLAWSVENRSEEPARPVRNREPIDPKWIEIILGKPDSARMKDCVEIVKSEATLDEKLAALDELEMLVESLDNANDLQPLKLWPELLNLLLTSNEPEVRVNVAWVMGTAVQNNERAQADFARAGGVSTLLSVLLKDTDPAVKIKLLYCLSGKYYLIPAAVRVSPQNFQEFASNDGFKVIVSACQDGNEQMIKRSLFLFDALMHEEDQNTIQITNTKIMENAVFEMIVDILSKHELDLDLVEQCFKLLISVGTYSKETVEMWGDVLKGQFDHILGALGNEDTAEVKVLIGQLQALI